MKYLLKHQTDKKLSNGKFYPLGATPEEDGVNFAVYSCHARTIYLLLFDQPAAGPTDIIELQCRTKNIWHVLVHGVRQGQLYAYKVSGDYEPCRGLRFNINKLLIDPYAKAVTGKLVNKDNLLFAYNTDAPSEKDLSFDSRDNTELVPKAIVIDDNDFDWQNDSYPDTPLSETIIYEVHLKGFTAHPSAKVKHPGSYLGFIEKIPYLKDLGITAVELLPVCEFYTEQSLLEKGLSNYWGYNTLCYFAPEISYSSREKPGCQVNEFKTLVRELHRAKIEIILDVVFNHSAEGNELGPTVCYRGFDNLIYYYLKGEAGDPARYYQDYTGCGNSLNASAPPVLKLIADSLRYWVEVMHVDGFRFDLASVLGREEGNFIKRAAFFETISQDPVLSRVKLIAEPWDLATYQVGNFPIDWAEWNGRFRDTMRKFAKGAGGQLGELASRIFGSQDIYKRDGRTAYHSINFITCHDGFTLTDLVSYNDKHNDENGENNRDGSNDNNSWNCGVEGPTENKDVIRLRKQLIKNLACFLFLSGGTPMLCGGDEFCRTQKGNNNAYCQDNELSWFDWDLLDKNKDIYKFFKGLIYLITRHKLIQKQKVIYGNILPPDINWYDSDLQTPDWNNPSARTLCFLIHDRQPGLEKIQYFFIFNSDYLSKQVKLPAFGEGIQWSRIIDTSVAESIDFSGLPSSPDYSKSEDNVLNPDYYEAAPRSVVLLRGGLSQRRFIK